MAAVNRSDSTLTFSPGPHRRSHPNLQHLSLAPLAPKYPVTPSDYDAYLEPGTTQLHTSTSLSLLSGPPTPTGILSDPASRAHSRSRPRKSKSNVSVRSTVGTPRPGLSSPNTDDGMLNTAAPGTLRSSSGRRDGPRKNDSSWLLQTGMALTEGSRESKGQSWIAKRASSTSLPLPSPEDYPISPFAPPRSGQATPTGSLEGGMRRGRRKSKKELAMTPATLIGPSTPAKPMSGGFLAHPTLPTSASIHDTPVIEPDWADSQTHAEIAADLDNQLARELDDDELYSNDDDRYEFLNFEEQGARDEEEELQQAVRSSGFRLGNWVDGIVDVFLKMDDADEEEPEIEQRQGEKVANPLALNAGQENQQSGMSYEDKMDDAASADEIEPAPSNPTSVWEDVAWFGRLIFRTARS